MAAENLVQRYSGAPKVLYKYASPQRIDILLEKKIRFTQPCFLNDPFEFRPGMPDRAAPFETRVARRREPQFRDKSRVYGVLSLAERRDSIPMWTHYASSHAGFVIGFDMESGFFREAFRQKKLGPVRYNEKRVSMTRGLPNQEYIRPEAVFRTKSTDWRYEEEWRWIESRSPYEYAQVRPAANCELLFLRTFPPESVKEIILGCRVNPNLAESILALGCTTEFKHVSINRAVPNSSFYKLDIEPA